MAAAPKRLAAGDNEHPLFLCDEEVDTVVDSETLPVSAASVFTQNLWSRDATQAVFCFVEVVDPVVIH